MIRRWIIRSFLIGLLLLSMGAWAWSYSICCTFYFKNGTDALGICFIDGVGIAGCDTSASSGHTGFNVETSRHILASEIYNIPGVHSFLGFLIGDTRRASGSSVIVGMPLWFVTGVLALAIIYVWRKTRPKPNPATAFPVELDKMKA